MRENWTVNKVIDALEKLKNEGCGDLPVHCDLCDTLIIGYRIRLQGEEKKECDTNAINAD